jgi:hypothetical protein
MNYRELALTGLIGSGAVESACRQKTRPLQTPRSVRTASGVSAPLRPQRGQTQRPVALSLLLLTGAGP